MRPLLRHICLTTLLLLALPLPGTAQPWRYDPQAAGPQPEPHVFHPAGFLSSVSEQYDVMARARYFRSAYRYAVNRGLYTQAITYSDSLIRISESHRIAGVRFIRCYKNRALALKALNRKAEAAAAYARAVKVQDSLMRLEQSELIREMQASYELDRLALDEALLRARHHRTALRWVLALMLFAGGAVAFIAAGNRRTKRLQHELLLHMDHARESEEKKTTFINSVCHEVRTPLNCITGFSELLCADEITSEAHAQYCEIIHDNRRQLRYIFDDLLEAAYLENLHEPLPTRYTDLCTLCRARLRVMKVRCPKPGVVYEDAIPADQIAMITSEKYLNILLAALLDNAYKFTERGFVRLECRREGDDRVLIAVSDSGCGIPPDKHEYVFERFTKLDTFSRGNGLGLHLCRLIVRHLGGHIRIDPDCKDGTRICVTLPRRPGKTR